MDLMPCNVSHTSQSSSFTVRIYEAGGPSVNRNRRSSLFGIREQWSTLFKQIAEIPISHQLFDCAILDDALFLMGSDGFLCLDNDNRYDGRPTELSCTHRFDTVGQLLESRRILSLKDWRRARHTSVARRPNR